VAATTPRPWVERIEELPNMPRATWHGTVLADAGDDAVEIVEGNVYFPPGAVKMQWLRPSEHHTVCGWKGTASYYDVVVDDAVNANAAWYYPETLPEAKHVEGYVAFWHGVEVER
jgi:uncharacterized protein (DUF427 family)